MQKPVKKCENFAVQGNVLEEMLKALDRPCKCMPHHPFNIVDTQTGRVSGRDANQSGPGSHGPAAWANSLKLPDYQTVADALMDLLSISSLSDVEADTGLPTKRCKEIMAIGKMLFDNAE